MYYPMTQYDLLGFEKSHLPAKKYNAVLAEKATGREIRVPFGAVGYAQYEDTTGLGLYTKQNHLNEARRARFRQRFTGFIRAGYFSPSYFAYFYLW